MLKAQGKLILVTLIAIGSIGGATAPGQQSPIPLMVEQVKPGLYAILNPGANTIAVRVTSEGVVLVDDMPERYSAEVAEKVRSITNQPVKYVINTHHHSDHTGGSAHFKALNS